MALWTMRSAWIVMLLADTAVALYGFMLMLAPAELLGAGYTMYTSRGWQALQATDPTTAAYFTMVSRVLGALNIAFGGPVQIPGRRCAPTATAAATYRIETGQYPSTPTRLS